jgi:hypothetical protein
MSETRNVADPVIKQVKELIVTAISKDDFVSAESLIGIWKERREYESTIQAKLAKYSGNPVASSEKPPTNDSSLRRILSEITGGALRQNYLSLNKAVKRGIVSRFEEFTIEIPVLGEIIKTPFTKGATFLRERFWIAQFFAAAHVNEGDFVELSETKPGHWVLKKAPSPAN